MRSVPHAQKAPFPWFGGKSKAAPLIWALLGDVAHYVEPFFGSGAVLLNRPHPCNRAYYSETVNDIDGYVVNFWRSVQWYPVETAQAASWPVTEADKNARQIALLRWGEAGGLERLAGDPTWCDPLMAGWWAWAVSVQIGALAWDGPWRADPVTGCITKIGRPGVKRERPHLTNNGQGVNRAANRLPGVRRERPHLSNDGQGVNRAANRLPGVMRQRPHLSSDGQGVNHAANRLPGVSLAREGALGEITAQHRVSALDGSDWGAEYHDLVMPGLIRWFRHLSARLRHVRVVNGDWTRVVTSGATLTLPVRQGKGVCGVFLDPPYSAESGRNPNLYAHGSLTVAHEVADWALAHGDDPRYRIVVAGFSGDGCGERLVEAGWREYEWFSGGWLQGGMGLVAGTSQQHRERLWASRWCLDPDAKPVDLQLALDALRA
jgi:hypothetical protein